MSSIDYTLQELRETVMPFGKHKGKPFEDIPRSYLVWLAKQPNLMPILKDKLSSYLVKSSLAQNWDRSKTE